MAGDWLRANLPAIDAVLCSTATRARETLAHIVIDAPVSYVDRLYDAVPGTVIDEINHVGDDVAVLLVVAHEPTMTQVALGLAGTDNFEHRCCREHFGEVSDFGDGGATTQPQLERPRTRFGRARGLSRAALSGVAYFLQISTVDLILSSRACRNSS